jgi:hypothetical protein
MRDPAKNAPVQAINGKCVGCSYRLAWIVIWGKRLADKESRRAEVIKEMSRVSLLSASSKKRESPQT